MHASHSDGEPRGGAELGEYSLTFKAKHIYEQTEYQAWLSPEQLLLYLSVVREKVSAVNIVMQDALYASNGELDAMRAKIEAAMRVTLGVGALQQRTLAGKFTRGPGACTPAGVRVTFLTQESLDAAIHRGVALACGAYLIFEKARDRGGTQAEVAVHRNAQQAHQPAIQRGYKHPRPPSTSSAGSYRSSQDDASGPWWGSRFPRK